jgi:hypothetical protein
LGGNHPQVLSCIKNIHPQGVWSPPHSNGSLKHVGSEWVRKPDNLQYHGGWVDNEINNNTVTTITQTAALRAASSSTGHTSGAGISAKVAVAINQLLANQTALMAQMVVLSFGTAPPSAQQIRVVVPNVLPIQQVAIPVGSYTAEEISSPPCMMVKRSAAKQNSQTFTKSTTIGMYVSVAALMSRTATCPARALSRNTISKINSYAKMCSSSLQWGTTYAQRVCTRRSCHPAGGTLDGVGQS